MKRSQLLVSMSAKCSIKRVNKNKSTWKLTHLCVLIRHVVRWDQISLNRTQLFIRGALLHTKSMDKNGEKRWNDACASLWTVWPVMGPSPDHVSILHRIILEWSTNRNAIGPSLLPPWTHCFMLLLFFIAWFEYFSPLWRTHHQQANNINLLWLNSSETLLVSLRHNRKKNWHCDSITEHWMQKSKQKCVWKGRGENKASGIESNSSDEEIIRSWCTIIKCIKWEPKRARWKYKRTILRSLFFFFISWLLRSDGHERPPHDSPQKYTYCAHLV